MKTNTIIYLDHNATTPVDPRVLDAMIPYLTERFGNPSSAHALGVEAKRAVSEARRALASVLGCETDEIIFTSGGSESNNLAVKGCALALRGKGRHILTTQIEHPSVLEACRHLEEEGFLVSRCRVDEFGCVDPAEIERLIRPDTMLISVMHANNEVGTIQPIREIARIAHRHGIVLHTDCAQSFGKIPVTCDALDADLISIAGHKAYAPKGIGVLFVRSGVVLEKMIDGAAHEMNLRAGTENVPLIAGFGEACCLIAENLQTYATRMSSTRDLFERQLKELFPFIHVNGHPMKRLPNTSSISFQGIEADLLLSSFRHIAASAGAACHSGSADISHVLIAMHVPMETARGTLRFSTGRTTAIEEINEAVNDIAAAVKALRPQEYHRSAEVPDDRIDLTRYTTGMGCACKMQPELLGHLLASLPASADERILVGTATSDDAAVYQIDERTAIVGTIDFFTPIVDDPFDFGAIAAANSLSDVYAMGAVPLFALSAAAFPSQRLPIGVMQRIVDGANSVASQAGIAIIGGHTIDDMEPKFGLVVTGIVSPQNIVRNSTMKQGDALILTKPLGTGIGATALKHGLLSDEDRCTLIRVMTQLNRSAAEAMQSVGVHACTDITGFGLAGHLLEMVRSSRRCAAISLRSIPLLPCTREMAAEGEIPGGTKNNRSYTDPFVDYDEGISEIEKLIVNDAQTSGGLLIAVSADKADALMKELQRKEIDTAAVIGHVTDEGDRIRIMR